jgi:hypothetical protein
MFTNTLSFSDRKQFQAKLYPLTIEEQEKLDEFLDENLSTCHIQPSQSPYTSSFFFVKKKEGQLRPVQDYRCLNLIMIKN